MHRVASLLAGISLMASAGCCCQHLCHRMAPTAVCPPTFNPACPDGACGVVTPGVTTPGVITPGVMTPGAAPLVQPQGFYGSYRVDTVTPVAIAPVVPQTAFVPLEALPTY